LTAREHAIAWYKASLGLAARDGVEWEAERTLCRKDLFYLLTVVLGRADVNHDWLFARCREVQAEPYGRVDLWARDHYKSTISTFGHTIQEILCDPEVTVGLFSVTRPIAKQFLRQIKREFEANEKLRALFPEILWDSPNRDAPKWSEDDGIIVKRQGNPKESTIEAWGLVDAQPTSKHFRKIKYDDAVTAESVTTPEMIAKVVRSWETSLALLAEGGKRGYTGTRWHHADLYKTILDRRAAVERRHAATIDGTEDGEPVFLTRESLAEKRRMMGPYTFGAQMLLNPTAGHAQGFKDEWLRYHQETGDADSLNKYILGDAASEKKRNSDYTALGVIGLGSDNNYYVLDMVRDRLNLTERGDALFALHRRWKPRGVAYESYGLMADVEYFQDRMRRENYHFEITKVGGQMPKPDRIKRLVPVCEQGRFYLPETCGKVDYEGKYVDLVQSFLNDEYRAFPVPAHDDMLDMLSRIFDIETVWPRAAAPAGDRYTRAHPPRRGRSQWAA
jgi:phage terminase large subunit-like protein